MKRLIALLMIICIVFIGCNKDEFTRLKKDERIFLELSTDEQIKVVESIAKNMKDSIELSQQSEYYKNNQDEKTKIIDQMLTSLNEDLKNPKKLLDGFKDGMKDNTTVELINTSYELGNLVYDLRKFSDLSQEEISKIYSMTMNLVEYHKETEKPDIDLEKLSETLKNELKNDEYNNLEVFKAIQKISEKIQKYVN